MCGFCLPFPNALFVCVGLLWHAVVISLSDFVALLVFGSIIRGSSLSANYHKVDELCGSQITSVIHYISVLL